MKTGWILALLLIVSLHAKAQLPLPKKSGTKYGYVTAKGEWLLQPEFQYATHFSGGIALVQKNDRWGYIDSTGSFVVQPVYTAATPVQNGFARVFDKTKTGIVGANGTLVAAPVFDSINSNYQGHFLFKGTQKGFANADFSFVSPVIYTTIQQAVYGYYNCLKPDGLWDVYTQETLLMENVQRPLTYDDYLGNSKLAFFKKNGKYGVFQLGKGWLFEPQFDSIIAVPFARYVVGNNYFNEVYLLWNQGPDPDPDSRKDQQFQVMGGDGTLLSKETFYTYEPTEHDPGSLQFSNGEITMYLREGLRTEHLPYTSIIRHLEWYIAAGNGKKHILDEAFRVVATFDGVERISVTEFTEYYDEMFQFTEGHRTYIEQLPFVIVEQQKGDKRISALYCLNRREVVSPYFDHVTVRSVDDFHAQRTGYIYRDGDGYEGIYLPGMDMGTDAVFLQIAVLEDGRMMCNDYESKHAQLWDLSGSKPRLILEAYTLFQSSGFRSTAWEIDTISGEVNEVDMGTVFSDQFYLLRNETGKWGVLCDNGMVTACSFDSVGQNTHAPNLLDVVVDGKFGLLNRSDGSLIAPFSAVPLAPQFCDYRRAWCVAVFPENEPGYFLDHQGVFYNLDMVSNCYPFTANGNKGIRTVCTFSEEEKVVIPPIYKDIHWVESETILFKAKGANGRWGLLDFKGDTVAPFVFKTLEEVYFTYNEQTVVIGKNGKQWGMYDCRGRTLVPYGKAQTWGELMTADGPSGLLRIGTAERFGLLTCDGRELLPQQFENIAVTTTLDESASRGGKIIQVQRSGKWWALPAIIPAGYENRFTTAVSGMVCDTTRMYGPYDFVIGDWYYRENAPGDYTIDRITSVKTPVQETGPLLPVTEGGLQLVVENGKIGVALLQDEGQTKLVHKPTFTNVSIQDEYTLLVTDKGTTFYYDYTNKKRYNIESW